MVLSAAIEIGRRLTEAKSMVPHGEWGEYLKNEVEFSQSSANNFMRIFEEYGDNQSSLFENSQALDSLPYTKALRLLALPAEERTEFAESHDVEAMSTRELEKAIRERDKARADASLYQDRARQAQERAEKAQRWEGEAEKLRAELKKAQAAEQEALGALKQAQENPAVPDAVLEQMRREAESQAAKDTKEQLEKQLKAAQDKADREQEALRHQLEEARKKEQDAREERAAVAQKLDAALRSTKLQNPDAAVFKATFEQVQTDFNRLQGALLKVKMNDADLGTKLQNATQALLAKLKEDIG